MLNTKPTIVSSILNPRAKLDNQKVGIGAFNYRVPNLAVNHSHEFYQDSNTLYNDTVVLVNDPNALFGGSSEKFAPVVFVTADSLRPRIL